MFTIIYCRSNHMLKVASYIQSVLEIYSFSLRYVHMIMTRLMLVVIINLMPEVYIATTTHAAALHMCLCFIKLLKLLQLTHLQNLATQYPYYPPMQCTSGSKISQFANFAKNTQENNGIIIMEFVWLVVIVMMSPNYY